MMIDLAAVNQPTLKMKCLCNWLQFTKRADTQYCFPFKKGLEIQNRKAGRLVIYRIDYFILERRRILVHLEDI